MALRIRRGIVSKMTKVVPFGVLALLASVSFGMVQHGQSAYADIVLAKPALVSPTNNSTVDGTTLINKWQPVDGATSYIYESYNDAAMKNKRWSQPTTETQKSANNVAHGTTFWWRVKAAGTDGKESDWSDLWKVTINNSMPTVPSITAPTNGQKFNSNEIRASWNASSDPQGIKEYEIEYRYVRDGNEVTDYRKTSELYRDQKLSGNVQGDFTIRIRAIDTLGNKSDWSAPVTYTYDSIKPTVPSGGQPHEQIVKDVTLSWDASTDAGTGIARYELMLVQNDPDSGPFSIDPSSSNNPAEPSMNLGSGLPEGDWYWRIQAHDGAGNASGWSNFWKFTVDTSAPVVTIQQVNTAIPSVDEDILLAGKADDRSGVKKLVLFYGNTSVEVPVNSDGTWSHTIVGGFSVKGIYSIRAEATDIHDTTTTEEASLAGAINVEVAAFIPPATGTISTGVTSRLSERFPAISSPRNVTVPTPTVVDEEKEDADVLGSETTKEADLGDIAKSPAIAATESGWSFFGIAWYWWLFGAGGIGSAAWWMIASRRSTEAL